MSRAIVITLGILTLSVLFYLLVQSEPDEPLTNVSVDQVEDVDEANTSRFTDTTWSWVETVYTDGDIVAPNQPDLFRLNFTAEPGRLAVQTDCNSMMGSYGLEGDDVIVFSEMATTLMYCEGSQEQVFASMLQQVERYRVVDQQLIFLLESDEAQMVFDLLPSE